MATDLETLKGDARDIAMLGYEDLAEGLIDKAYALGASQYTSDLDRLGRKLQALEAENIRLNSQINQLTLKGMIGGR